MAQGALHTATVLFVLLMAHQTDVTAPFRQPGLVSCRMAGNAGCYVGQLRHMVPFGVFGVTQPAVGRDLMMKGMAARAYLQVRLGPRFTVARSTVEPHGCVGFMGELTNLGGQKPLRRGGMAKRTVRGGSMVQFMAGKAGIPCHRHGRPLVTKVTLEPHGEMGIMQEVPGLEGERVTHRPGMADSA